MIALNEIISNKELFEKKYKLMGKNFNLDKIINLEKNFIFLDKKANELRAECNKMCSEIAELVNTKIDTSVSISKINILDKNIASLEKKASKAMKKINKMLNRLPNLPLDENILNIPIKTKESDFTKENLISEIEKLADVEYFQISEKSYLNTLRKIVFKSENLPKLVNVNSNKQKYLLLCGSNALDLFEQIKTILTKNAKYVTLKSIKFLKRDCSREITAVLSDKSIISLEFLGEFASRTKSIKLYDKTIDMTKFVNIIRICIK